MSKDRSEDAVASERLARQFHALGNPHRLQIFVLLANCCAPGDMTPAERVHRYVGELAEHLTLAPSTVSHHLKELREAGLIRMERRGQSVECWVDPATLERLGAFFSMVCRPCS